MRDQNGCVLTVVAAFGILILVAMIGGGFVYWRLQRVNTAQRVAEINRLEEKQQREIANQKLAEQADATDATAELPSTKSQSTDAEEVADIKAVLLAQQAAWNRGDIDAFMESYWKADELTFSSGGSTTRSWRSTLDRYKQKYSTREAMATLKFSDLEVHLLASNAAFVLGRWELKDKSGGNFTLVMRKLPDGWVIVHDHTSADKESVE